jgi:hypothetical protein
VGSEVKWQNQRLSEIRETPVISATYNSCKINGLGWFKKWLIYIDFLRILDSL